MSTCQAWRESRATMRRTSVCGSFRKSVDDSTSSPCSSINASSCTTSAQPRTTTPHLVDKGAGEWLCQVPLRRQQHWHDRHGADALRQSAQATRKHTCIVEVGEARVAQAGELVPVRRTGQPNDALRLRCATSNHNSNDVMHPPSQHTCPSGRSRRAAGTWPRQSPALPPQSPAQIDVTWIEHAPTFLPFLVAVMRCVVLSAGAAPSAASISARSFLRCCWTV